MPTERASLPPAKDRSPVAPKDAVPPQRAGRSGEGARSVIPHLRADLKARAVAKIGKRAERDI